MNDDLLLTCCATAPGIADHRIAHDFKVRARVLVVLFVKRTLLLTFLRRMNSDMLSGFRPRLGVRSRAKLSVHHSPFIDVPASFQHHATMRKLAMAGSRKAGSPHHSLNA